MNVGDCAGEFGNPSGHAMHAAHFTFTVFRFYREKHSDIVSRHPWLSPLGRTLCFAFMILMGIDRFYLGRHTVD